MTTSHVFLRIQGKKIISFACRRKGCSPLQLVQLPACRDISTGHCLVALEASQEPTPAPCSEGPQEPGHVVSLSLGSWVPCAFRSSLSFSGTGVSNSELDTCKTGTLPLDLQSILLWLFWRWGLTNYFPGLTSKHDPSIEPSPHPIPSMQKSAFITFQSPSMVKGGGHKRRNWEGRPKGSVLIS
jgi:hypothetical protein